MTQINRMRLVLLLLALCLVAAALWLDTRGFLSLRGLQAQFAALTVVVHANFFGASAGFFLLYVGLTALSVPAAALVLTLAGGALFGVIWGSVLVSFASAIGAAASCLLSRVLLREFVETLFPYAVDKVNQGVRDDGAYYLFGLRLVPLFPYFVVNLVMGLTRMPLGRYYWVSQLGMLPGTLVFVNAGTQLARIEHAADVLSPGVAGSLTLLGLFPLLAKKTAAAVMAWHRRHP